MHPAAKRRTEIGERTRVSILQVAADLASADGLETLSIGSLATATSMSKSGLFAHFGSKEELQVAVVEYARTVFVNVVTRPALTAPRGICRLMALHEQRLGYMERGVFRGGCFFYATAAEFDGRPGPIRDRVAAVMREWQDLTVSLVAKAQALAHLRPEVDAEQLAFELSALTVWANTAHQLLEDPAAFGRARVGLHQALLRAATPAGEAALAAWDGIRE